MPHFLRKEVTLIFLTKTKLIQNLQTNLRYSIRLLLNYHIVQRLTSGRTSLTEEDVNSLRG